MSFEQDVVLFDLIHMEQLLLKHVYVLHAEVNNQIWLHLIETETSDFIQWMKDFKYQQKHVFEHIEFWRDV